MHTDAQLVTLIFTIVTGVGVLLQAFVMFGIFLAVRKTGQKVNALAEKVEDHVLPLVATSRGVLDDLAPKLRVITNNLVESSATLRSQTEHVKIVVDDISARTRTQTARVDNIITSTLNSVMQATTALERGVAGPIRQVSGLLNGLRAGLGTLRPKEQPASTRGAAGAQPASPVSRPAAVTPVNDFATEETSPAATRFMRDRAAASSGERR